MQLISAGAAWLGLRMLPSWCWLWDSWTPLSLRVSHPPRSCYLPVASLSPAAWSNFFVSQLVLRGKNGSHRAEAWKSRGTTLLCPIDPSKQQREGKDRCHLLVGRIACTYRKVRLDLLSGHLCGQSTTPTPRNHHTAIWDKALSVPFLVVVLRTESFYQITHS